MKLKTIIIICTIIWAVFFPNSLSKVFLNVMMIAVNFIETLARPVVDSIIESWANIVGV